jgi:predicted ATPase/transcriptional regulator with XRE-family HTH domain
LAAADDGMRTSDSFAGLLREYRLAAGLTQEALCERARVSVRSLQGLEAGAQRPQKDTARRLVEALGLPEGERARLVAAAVPAPRRAAGGSHTSPGAAVQPPSTAIPQSLPSYLTSFVGRQRETAAVGDLLARHRLLTLTGPGGVGKTRLALYVASAQRDWFADGVVFVPLATVSDPALAGATVAAALGVQQGGRASIADALVAYLQPKRLLLVLDNFEQLVTAAPLITQLLAAAPALTVLVTSRMPLHLYGEQEFAVPPLQVLAAGDPVTLDTVRSTSTPAVALFVQRARLANPEFALTEQNVKAVIEICRRLDGLPLAIELAAARAKMLPPSTLLAQLGQSLQVLIGGPHDVPARQQTLRNTIAWSYALLSPYEQLLFSQLAVFVGGCSLDAAQLVCDAANAGADSVLEGLVALADRSLLRQESTSVEPRFVLLETIREFAHEDLESRQMTEDLARRHARYFTGLAEQAFKGLVQAEQLDWLGRLDRDYGNLRAAAGWCVDHARDGDREATELGLRLVVALWQPYGILRGHGREQRAWLLVLLASPHAAAPSPGRALGLAAAGHLAHMGGDPQLRDVLLAESLTIARQLGSCEATILSLFTTGIDTAEPNARSRYLSEMLSVARIAGDKAWETWALIYLGFAAVDMEDLDRARGLFEEGRTLAVTRGDRWAISQALEGGAQAARATGDLASARRQFEARLPLCHTLGDKHSLGHTLWMLGEVAEEQGETARALTRYAEALATLRDVWDVDRIAAVLHGIATLAVAAGQPRRAMHMAGTAAAVRGPTWPSWQQDRRSSQIQEAVRRVLGDEEAGAAWSAGQAIPLEQAIADALGALKSDLGRERRPNRP